jgi:hypothetical protein
LALALPEFCFNGIQARLEALNLAFQTAAVGAFGFRGHTANIGQEGRSTALEIDEKVFDNSGKEVILIACGCEEVAVSASRPFQIPCGIGVVGATLRTLNKYTFL